MHAASGGDTRFQTNKKSMIFQNLNDVYIISMLVFATWELVVMECIVVFTRNRESAF